MNKRIKKKQKLVYEHLGNNDVEGLEECSSFDELMSEYSVVEDPEYRNPIHARLSGLNPDGLLCFSLLIVERLYPNFALYIKEAKLDNNWLYLCENAINTCWDSLISGKKKIDKLDSILEQLQEFSLIIDEVGESEVLIEKVAFDAYISMCELLHAFLGADANHIAKKVSLISIYNIADYISQEEGKVLEKKDFKDNEWINQELDWQWSFYRSLKNYETISELNRIIAQLRIDLEEDLFSNLGVKLYKGSKLIQKHT